MDELTINQLMDITGLSYPTALSFAKQHGRQVENGGKRAKWFVPMGAIYDYVSNERSRVNVMWETFVMYRDSGK